MFGIPFLTLDKRTSSGRWRKENKVGNGEVGKHKFYINVIPDLIFLKVIAIQTGSMDIHQSLRHKSTFGLDRSAPTYVQTRWPTKYQRSCNSHRHRSALSL